MILVKASNGIIIQFPYRLNDLRNDNPGISFPDDPSDDMLERFSAYKVFYHPYPEFDQRTQYVNVVQIPVLIDGIWTMTRDVVDKTVEDIAAYDANEFVMLRIMLTKNIDARTDSIILNGFVFHDQSIRMNDIDQRNYEGMYRMIKDYLEDKIPEIYIFPTSFKVWTNDDGSPVFLRFTNFTDMKAFMYTAKIFINNTLKSGWDLKDQLSTLTIDGMRVFVDPR